MVVATTDTTKGAHVATTIKGSGKPPARSAGIGIALIVLAWSCTSHRAVGLAADEPAGRDTTTSVHPSAPSSRSAGSGVERPVVDGTPLSSGRPYRVTGVLQDIDVVFTGPSTPVYGHVSGHRLALSLDKEGRQTVLSVVPVANPRVFPTPDVVLERVEDELASVTTDAPVDILTWMAARPYLSAGPIKDGVDLGGLTGRELDYVVGELSDGARACGATAPTRCAATIWASGVVDHVAPGEHGRIVELDAAGQRLLVHMTDTAATDELLASLEFELWPVPEQVADARRLPYFAPNLLSGQHYLIDRVSKGLGLVTTAPMDAVTASQREELVWFGNPIQSPARRQYFFVAADADTAVANSDSTLDPYAIGGPGGIPLWQLQRFLRATSRLSDDPVSWLLRQPYVEVVRPARSATIGGVTARVADVRVAAGTAGFPCPGGVGVCAMPFVHASDAFPMVISSEYVTRIIDFRLGDHRLLMIADLQTPGETLLNGLCAFEINPNASGPACRRDRAHP